MSERRLADLNHSRSEKDIWPNYHSLFLQRDERSHDGSFFVSAFLFRNFDNFSRWRATGRFLIWIIRKIVFIQEKSLLKIDGLFLKAFNKFLKIRLNFLNFSEFQLFQKPIFLSLLFKSNLWQFFYIDYLIIKIRKLFNF